MLVIAKLLIHVVWFFVAGAKLAIASKPLNQISKLRVRVILL